MRTPTVPPASPPPFRLVALHFAAALGWLLVGAAGLLAVAPRLAAGDLFAPHVLGVTHAFTLGVLTTMIFGALYQFFPSTLGIGARSIPVAHRTFWVLQAGTATLVAGFWAWRPALLPVAWGLLFLAVGGLAWNLLPQRRRARQGLLVGRYVSAGHMALGLAMVLGLLRIGEPLGWWSVSRTGMIAAHYHLAAVGFVTLTIVGVGSRMVPMLLFAQQAPTWPLRLIGPVGGLGLLVHAAGLLGSLGWVITTGGVLVGTAGLLLIGQLGLWFRHRARRGIDPAVGHLLLAGSFLVVVVMAGFRLLFASGPFDPRAWAAYGLLGILGWLLPFTLGVAHRIVPFLSWLHLFGGRGRGAHAPPAQALVHRGVAWAALASWGAGVAVLVLSVQAGDEPMARVGAALVAAAAAGQGAQVLRGAWLWRETPSDPDPGSSSPRPAGRPLEVLS